MERPFHDTISHHFCPALHRLWSTKCSGHFEAKTNMGGDKPSKIAHKRTMSNNIFKAPSNPISVKTMHDWLPPTGVVELLV